MKNFIVEVIDDLGETYSVICRDRVELSTLLLHLDSDKYSVKDIKGIDNVSLEIKTFCKAENFMEIGGNESC